MRTIKVQGMSCAHCVRAVKQALEQIDGISNVAVSLERGEVSFEEKQPVDPGVLREKIQKAGYELG